MVRATTIKDVAREAGVSIASVSRVLNGKGGVTEDARSRVKEAVNSLKYVPHAGARSLITRKTETIGVVLPDLHGEFFSELIRAIDQAARRKKWHLLLATAHDDADEAIGAIRALLGRVDGLLIMSPHLETDLLDRHLPPSVPVVLMNSQRTPAGHETIRIDNFAGAVAMTRHLLARGHRSIAHISGPEDNLESFERLSGYEYALKEAGAGHSPRIYVGDFSEGAGRGAAQRIIAEGDLPDAIFAANDMMAVGCFDALREAGVSVPDRIALAGFDDIPIARYLATPLTTVRSHIDRLGDVAFDDLFALIMGNEPSGPSVITPEIIVRASCGERMGRANSHPHNV